MQDQYILTSIPYAFQSYEKRSESVPLPQMAVITVGDAIRHVRDEWARYGLTEIVVTRNDHFVSDPYSEIVEPGDCIGITSRHGFEFVASWVWMALYTAGMYAGINVAAYAIAGAIIVGAGILVNTFMGAPAAPGSSSQGLDSPTYGWSGANPTQAGYPVPVVYGNACSTPPILQAFRTLDGDMNMWQYLLFALCEGETNNPLSIGSVLVGSEYLSNMADYSFGATDGSMSPDAADISDFDATRHDRIFDRVLPYDETVIIATKGDCDNVDIIVEFPNGLFTIDEESGDINGMTVYIQVGYQVGSGAVTWLDTPSGWYIADSKTTVVRKSKQVILPSRGQYNIHLKRDTADDPSGDSTQRSTCYLSSFCEVLALAQTYPGMQVAQVGLKASDRVSGSVPRIQIIHNRTGITVPSWNGLSTQSVSAQSPMWAAYDMFTNPYSGRGISPTKLVKTAWEEWATWCAATVDGNQRCQCNLVVDERGNFGDNGLRYVEDVGRARIVQYGDLWSVIVDKPRTTPAYTFSAGNMWAFSWDSYEDPEKVDAVEVVYWDKDQVFARTSILARASWYESLTTMPRTATIELRACNNAEQATREAIFRMQKTEMVTRHGTLETGLQAGFCERGDRIDIIHPTNLYGYGGRIVGDLTAASTVRIDQIVTLSTAAYSGKGVLYLVDPDGTRYALDILGPFDEATQDIQIDGTYTGSRFDTWAIGRPTEEKLAYQILNKKVLPATEKRPERIQIEFCEYVDEMFYNAAYDSGNTAI